MENVGRRTRQPSNQVCKRRWGGVFEAKADPLWGFYPPSSVTWG
jgi:hypothetical protein